MPVPYARLTSEDLVTNLQLYFWRVAIEHFQDIKANLEDYPEEADFDVDASVTLVLAGTSVSQLLGQQQTTAQKQMKKFQDRVPLPLELFDVAIVPPDPKLRDRFKDFLVVYDSVRHFGEQKYDIIGNIDEAKLCELMTTAQDIWKAIVGPTGLPYTDLDHTFDLTHSEEEDET